MPVRKVSSKKIAIVTEWGDQYGMGHIQRMESLLHHITTKMDWMHALFHPPIPLNFPESIRRILFHVFPPVRRLLSAT